MRRHIASYFVKFSDYMWQYCFNNAVHIASAPDAPPITSLSLLLSPHVLLLHHMVVGKPQKKTTPSGTYNLYKHVITMSLVPCSGNKKLWIFLNHRLFTMNYSMILLPSGNVTFVSLYTELIVINWRFSQHFQTNCCNKTTYVQGIVFMKQIFIFFCTFPQWKMRSECSSSLYTSCVPLHR